MSKSLRTLVVAAAAALTFASLATPALADTTWQAQHPRRAQVNSRLANQSARIHQEVKSGRISRAKAARLHRADHRIRSEERRMAARHGGHITKAEQRRLNRQEDHVSHRIGS